MNQFFSFLLAVSFLTFPKGSLLMAQVSTADNINNEIQAKEIPKADFQKQDIFTVISEKITEVVEVKQENFDDNSKSQPSEIIVDENNEYRSLYEPSLLQDDSTGSEKSVTAATYYSRASGEWKTSTTWSTAGCDGVAAASTPGAAASDVAIICNGHTVSVTADPSNQLVNVTIQTGGYLKCGTTGGGANKQFSITAGGTFVIQAGGTYDHNTTTAASGNVFNGTETFDAASSIIISKWSGTTTNLITGCSSNFGNLTLNYSTGAFIWQCDGLGSTRTIQGSFTVGSACIIFLNNSAGNITVTIGGDLTVNGALYVKYNVSGNVNMTVAGTTSVISATGYFFGIRSSSGAGTGSFNLTTNNLNLGATGYFFGIYGVNAETGNCVIQVNNDFIMNDGTATQFIGIQDTRGNAFVTISGTYSQSSNSTFLGIYNRTSYFTGYVEFTTGTFNFTGGTNILQSGANSSVANDVKFITTGNCNVSFGAVGNIFRIVGFAGYTGGPDPNLSSLTFTVGGNLTIGGSAAGEFTTSIGKGNEICTFNGNVNISQGNNNFNNYSTAPLLNFHNTSITVAGDLTVSAGTTNFSVYNGTLICNLQGNVSISGGTLNTSTDATSNLNLTVGTASITWAQTGGTASLCNTNVKTGKTVTLTGSKIGDVQASRTIIVESGATLNCSNYPVSGTGNVTLSSGATIGIGSADGIVSAGATGNVQVSGTRSYNSGATYRYYEGLTPQSTGNFTTTPTASTVANMIIDKATPSDIVNLTNTTDINNTLTLTNGILTTSYTPGANPYIRIKSGSTVSPAGGSANSYVDGYIRKTGNIAFIFPTGNSGEWRRLGIDAPSVATEFEARYVAADYPNTTSFASSPTPIIDHVSTIEHWFLNKPLGADAATTKVTLYWEDASESGLYKFDSLVVARFNGAEWENTNAGAPDYTSSTVQRTYTGSAAGSGAGTIRSNTVSNFSPFTLASIGTFALNPLPVELISFISVCYNNVTELLWSTASEKNSDYFEVEKSSDGLNFTPFTRVASAGNSNTVQTYTAVDFSPFAGNNYYRLHQFDFDGKDSYSEIITSECKNISVIEDISPVNSFEKNLEFILSGIPGKTYKLNISNVIGQVLAGREIVLTENRQNVKFDNLNLSNGIYYVVLHAESYLTCKPVVVCNK